MKNKILEKAILDAIKENPTFSNGQIARHLSDKFTEYKESSLATYVSRTRSSHKDTSEIISDNEYVFNFSGCTSKQLSQVKNLIGTNCTLVNPTEALLKELYGYNVTWDIVPCIGKVAQYIPFDSLSSDFKKSILGEELNEVVEPDIVYDFTYILDENENSVGTCETAVAIKQYKTKEFASNKHLFDQILDDLDTKELTDEINILIKGNTINNLNAVNSIEYLQLVLAKHTKLTAYIETKRETLVDICREVFPNFVLTINIEDEEEEYDADDYEDEDEY